MMLPKDITTHNQSETLASMFVLLSRALGPIIIPRGPEYPPEVIQPVICSGVKTAIETALISICNRIADVVNEPDRWDTGDKEMMALYKMGLMANIRGLADSLPKGQKPKGKKGTDEETQA